MITSSAAVALTSVFTISLASPVYTSIATAPVIQPSAAVPSVDVDLTLQTPQYYYSSGNSNQGVKVYKSAVSTYTFSNVRGYSQSEGTFQSIPKGMTSAMPQAPSVPHDRVAPQPAIAWATLHTKLVSWRSLPQDWDGDGGQALSQTTIKNAIAFLHPLQVGALPAPEVYLTGDDEVGFRWRNGERFGEASFHGDGNIVVYALGHDRSKPYKLDEPYSPKKGKEAVRQIQKSIIS